MASAVMVLIVVALLGLLAQARGKRALAVGLVVLLGALAGQVPGSLGSWVRSVATWVLDLPADIARLVG